MAQTVTMPKLGFDMAEGTLVRWVIAEGQPVHKGAVLAEIETDKATVEVESNFDGIVARYLVSEQDVVPVNTPIAIITDPGEELDEAQIASMGQAAPSAQAEGTEAETPAVASGETAPTAPAAGAPQAVEPGAPVKASPIARRIAQDKGIDLATIAGSGPGGRIVKKDVEAATVPVAIPAVPRPEAPRPEAPTPTRQPTIRPVSLPSAQSSIVSLPEKTVPLSRLRTAIARRMAEAKQQVPHFYVTHDYDMAALMALRKQINAMLPEEEKVSVNDLIVKAVALTLRGFPNLNASFQGNQVVQHGAINMGVAVAVEGGLLTVVCKNADQKPVRLIANEVKTLVGRAREGKVRPDDIEGSTFSVSNLGMYDVEVFSAIINPPESAILAIGSVKEVPVVKDGQLTVGTRMKATISVDHRVSDGVEAAKFMQALADPLENPLKLLL